MIAGQLRRHEAVFIADFLRIMDDPFGSPLYCDFSFEITQLRLLLHLVLRLLSNFAI